MDASQPGDGDEAPVDVTIELLFDDGGDEPEDGGDTHAEVAAPARPVGGLRPDLDGDARVGEVGLRNLGNTCYMNSVLQALAHVPPLRAYFTSGEFRYDINTRSKFGARGALATAFGELLGELDESEEAVTPDTFKRTLGDWNDTFAGFGQQDASEFLQQLLEGLGEDLNRVEEKPYVENPDVAGDAESPFPADPRVQVDVAAECWRNHAELREDHPVTALFGGQTRRELVCDANDVEKSAAGREKRYSTSLQRECFARARFGNSTHASRALREMMARPKISRNERKTTEIEEPFEVGKFARFSCPGPWASTRSRRWPCPSSTPTRRRAARRRSTCACGCASRASAAGPWTRSCPSPPTRPSATCSKPPRRCR
jgi:hypothetical protein